MRGQFGKIEGYEELPKSDDGPCPEEGGATGSQTEGEKREGAG